jgi:hypothetical protein
MKTNVGALDRFVRVTAGLALIGATTAGLIGLWGWLGLIPLLTGAIGNCPLYSALGWSTCPVNKT